LIPIENAPDLFRPEHEYQKTAYQENNPGGEYYPRVSAFTSCNEKDNCQGKSYQSGKVYPFALFKKSHQLFNNIGPEKICNPHKSKEHTQTLNNYNNMHRFILSLGPRWNRFSKGCSSDTVILNSRLFDYIGIIKVSAVKNHGLVKFFCYDFEVWIAKLLPVGEDNQRISAIK
jgi:hypothetical protein